MSHGFEDTSFQTSTTVLKRTYIFTDFTLGGGLGYYDTDTLQLHSSSILVPMLRWVDLIG